MKKEIKQTNNQKNIKVRREKNVKKKYHEKQKTIKNWTCFFQTGPKKRQKRKNKGKKKRRKYIHTSFDSLD